jgi:hypothetical protein
LTFLDWAADVGISLLTILFWNLVALGALLLIPFVLLGRAMWWVLGGER